MAVAVPMLSIIIPNYNYSRFVGQAIKSSLGVNSYEKEIIVVDDGSTDDSLSVIRQFIDERTVKLIAKDNSGQPDSINYAFQKTRGDVIYILDADDMVYPSMLREVLLHWDDNVSKVQFGLDVVNADGKPTGSSMRFTRSLSPSEVRQHLLRTGAYPWTPTSGGVFSRAFMEKVLPLDKRLWADCTLSTLAPLYGNVVTITKSLAQYRIHEANNSAPNKLDIKVRQRYLRQNVLRDDLLHRHCDKLGIRVNPRSRNRDISDLRDRLVSLKLDRAHHPIAGDYLLALVLRALYAIAIDPWNKPSSKLRWMLWHIVMAISPKSVAKQLAVMLYDKTARPKFGIAMLRFIVGRGGGKRP